MKRIQKILIYLFSVIVLSSCNHYIQFDSDSNQAKNEKNHVSKDSNSKTTKLEHRLTFGIIYPVAHPFFEAVTLSAKEKAEQMGINIVIQAPDATNVAQQIQIFENMIQNNYDGIAIGPTDPIALTPYINRAVENGINVICFDTDAPESKRLSFIGTDNIAAGKHLGDVVARFLNYEGSIIVSSGISTMLNLNARIEGLKEFLGKYPNIKILDIKYSDGIPSKTLHNIENMVDQYPNFDALVGVDSLSGPAAVTVWKATGLNKKVIAFDDLKTILNGIANKQITSTISQQQFKWGELIINTLYQAYQGKEVSTTVYTDTYEVNLGNLSSYQKIANISY